jgi:hypothetical protein
MLGRGGGGEKKTITFWKVTKLRLLFITVQVDESYTLYSRKKKWLEIRAEIFLLNL